MKLLSRILLVGVLIVVLLAGVAFLLPRKYHVERSIEIEAPAALVFRYVGDLREWPRWTIWDEIDPAMTTVYSEKTTGVGATSRWDGPKAGKGQLKITAWEPGQRVVYDLSFEGFDVVSVGQISLSESNGVTRVTWSDAGDLGMNPLNRWFGLAMDKVIGPDFEAGLAGLKALCEAPEVLGAAPDKAAEAARGAVGPAPASP